MDRVPVSSYFVDNRYSACLTRISGRFSKVESSNDRSEIERLSKEYFTMIELLTVHKAKMDEDKYIQLFEEAYNQLTTIKDVYVKAGFSGQDFDKQLESISREGFEREEDYLSFTDLLEHFSLRISSNPEFLDCLKMGLNQGDYAAVLSWINKDIQKHGGVEQLHKDLLKAKIYLLDGLEFTGEKLLYKQDKHQINFLRSLLPGMDVEALLELHSSISIGKLNDFVDKIEHDDRYEKLAMIKLIYTTFEGTEVDLRGKICSLFSENFIDESGFPFFSNIINALPIHIASDEEFIGSVIEGVNSGDFSTLFSFLNQTIAAQQSNEKLYKEFLEIKLLFLVVLQFKDGRFKYNKEIDVDKRKTEMASMTTKKIKSLVEEKKVVQVALAIKGSSIPQVCTDRSMFLCELTSFHKEVVFSLNRDLTMDVVMKFIRGCLDESIIATLDLTEKEQYIEILQPYKERFEFKKKGEESIKRSFQFQQFFYSFFPMDYIQKKERSYQGARMMVQESSDETSGDGRYIFTYHEQGRTSQLHFNPVKTIYHQPEVSKEQWHLGKVIVFLKETSLLANENYDWMVDQVRDFFTLAKGYFSESNRLCYENEEKKYNFSGHFDENNGEKILTIIDENTEQNAAHLLVGKESCNLITSEGYSSEKMRAVCTELIQSAYSRHPAIHEITQLMCRVRNLVSNADQLEVLTEYISCKNKYGFRVDENMLGSFHRKDQLMGTNSVTLFQFMLASKKKFFYSPKFHRFVFNNDKVLLTIEMKKQLLLEIEYQLGEKEQEMIQQKHHFLQKYIEVMGTCSYKKRINETDVTCNAVNIDEFTSVITYSNTDTKAPIAEYKITPVKEGFDYKNEAFTGYLELDIVDLYAQVISAKLHFLDAKQFFSYVNTLQGDASISSPEVIARAGSVHETVSVVDYSFTNTEGKEILFTGNKGKTTAYIDPELNDLQVFSEPGKKFPEELNVENLKGFVMRSAPYGKYEKGKYITNQLNLALELAPFNSLKSYVSSLQRRESRGIEKKSIFPMIDDLQSPAADASGVTKQFLSTAIPIWIDAVKKEELGVERTMAMQHLGYLFTTMYQRYKAPDLPVIATIGKLSLEELGVTDSIQAEIDDQCISGVLKEYEVSTSEHNSLKAASIYSKILVAHEKKELFNIYTQITEVESNVEAEIKEAVVEVDTKEAEVEVDTKEAEVDTKEAEVDTKESTKSVKVTYLEKLFIDAYGDEADENMQLLIDELHESYEELKGIEERCFDKPPEEISSTNELVIYLQNNILNLKEFILVCAKEKDKLIKHDQKIAERKFTGEIAKSMVKSDYSFINKILQPDFTDIFMAEFNVEKTLGIFSIYQTIFSTVNVHIAQKIQWITEWIQRGDEENEAGVKGLNTQETKDFLQFITASVSVPLPMGIIDQFKPLRQTYLSIGNQLQSLELNKDTFKLSEQNFTSRAEYEKEQEKLNKKYQEQLNELIEQDSIVRKELNVLFINCIHKRDGLVQIQPTHTKEIYSATCFNTLYLGSKSTTEASFREFVQYAISEKGFTGV